MFALFSCSSSDSPVSKKSRAIEEGDAGVSLDPLPPDSVGTGKGVAAERSFQMVLIHPPPTVVPYAPDQTPLPQESAEDWVERFVVGAEHPVYAFRAEPLGATSSADGADWITTWQVNEQLLGPEVSGAQIHTVQGAKDGRPPSCSTAFGFPGRVDLLLLEKQDDGYHFFNSMNYSSHFVNGGDGTYQVHNGPALSAAELDTAVTSVTVE